MRHWNTILSILIPLSLAAQGQRDYPIHAVPFTQVVLQDSFWLPKIEINRQVTIPASFEQCRITGRLRNFQMAAERNGKFCTVYPFDDTDIYKTLEGASYTLATHPDSKLDLFLDSIIALIGKAQEPDGYLYTARTIDPAHPQSWAGPARWMNEYNNSHELYCCGHLFEAAVAHYLATGKRNLLDIAIKNADLLVSVFGPGKLALAPGHEIVEMGLVKMYRVTGKMEYLNLAKFFLEQRGLRKYNAISRNVFENGKYWQAHEPVTEQSEVVGHAVRAMYLYAAMTDIAALTSDPAYLRAVDRLWENMVGRKIYLHGGIGSIGDGERFGENYELPNLTAYAETCAAVGNIFWNHRMFLLHGDSKYIDLLEKTLYNGLLSGVGLDGKSFFYTNAMEVKNDFAHPDLERERSGWFTCSCCPTNISRLIPAVPGYIYAWKGDSLYINLYVSSLATMQTDHGKIRLAQETNYPWDGKIKLSVEGETGIALCLRLRIPGWSRNEAMAGNLYRFRDNQVPEIRILINGSPAAFRIDHGYASITRVWRKGDQVELELPMPVQKILADTLLKEDAGKMALQRGPLIYCAEWPDNAGRTGNLLVPEQTPITAVFRPGLLHGVETLEADVPAITLDATGLQVTTRQQRMVAIPYYAWANRGPGEMNIWFPYRLKDIDLVAGN
jgi:DUF1680 family protein